MDADDRAFNLFQMEWERGRNLETKAKYIATISSVIIGFFLTSLSIVLTETLEAITHSQNNIGIWSFAFIVLALFCLFFSIYESALMFVRSKIYINEKSAIDQLFEWDNGDAQTSTENTFIDQIGVQLKKVQ
ncbi:hypothetical protein Mmah_1110 [Methanohalophilus mahii DSM 5219]|uniref:Uncharacterized protein n=1 Tax=Methanohalophilus mahii (strain ATCC 35705 / DSM 5219 / SLP) TaxID=547558 RepID=D5EBR6_METMS|nr:hypothetical protein Mmah_1110 [Methanohalophilus mahii DSM 5219]